MRALTILAPVAARWSPKLARGVTGRAASAAAFARWAASSPDRRRPLLLFHGASAGELRQVEPVLRRLRARHPEWQLVVTSFSPSGQAVAAELGGDLAGFLPWDEPIGVAAFLDALHPAAIVFSHGDVWPELCRAASARGIPLGLVAAALRRGSRRRRWPAAAVLRPAWRSLTAVGAITNEDARLLQEAGVPPDALTVTGDPRADAVLERLERAGPRRSHPELLVAGSTWPADEDILLRAFRSIRHRHPDARLVIAPHEPTGEGLGRLRASARSLGLPSPEPFEAGLGGAPLRVVETVGMLALIYPEGGMAYVGGGFGRAGLHSVLEPAAAGVPVVAGRIGAPGPDTATLTDAGGLVWLPVSGAVAALERQWSQWLEDGEARAKAGCAARRAVLEGRGAGDRSAALVEALVTTRTGRVSDPPR